MGADQPFAGDLTDTQLRIMRATLRALNEYGYAGLSIQRIADEADLSKSSFYHFFDGKDDLILTFLDFMLQQFQLPLTGEFGDDPLADLWVHLDFALVGIQSEQFPVADLVDDLEPADGGPYVELRSQAVHNDAFRDRFTNIDDQLQTRITDIIEAGVEQGVFRDVDATQMATFLITLAMGGLFRRATTDNPDMDAVRKELEAVIDARLLAEPQE